MREERSLFDAAIEGLERAKGNLARHLRETVSWVRNAVLGRAAEEPVGEDPAGETSGVSEKRQALLDRLGNIGRGEAGKDDADDRGASSEPLSSAEEVQKHIRQIEEQNRAQERDRSLEETHERESRRPEPERNDDYGLDR